MITQSKDLRKVSSGVKQAHRKKRLYDSGSRATLTRIGENKARTDRIKGGGSKMRVLMTKVVNVYDPKNKVFKKAAIRTVLENPANRHYARANIMTKGAIIDTEFGKAKITSRPGQEGAINATLMSKTT